MSRFFWLILAILFYASCNSTPESGATTSGVLSLMDSSKPMLQKVSAYQDEDEILVTYYVSDTTDWAVVKSDLLRIRDTIVGDYPEIKSVSLVGYTKLTKTPLVSKNPNFAWNHEVDEYRACVLDNNQGFWRFCYGGVQTTSGQVGDWLHIEKIGEIAK